MKEKSNKKYIFNQDIAIDVGFEESFMFSNLYFWVNKNIGKEDHFHERKYWMYSTVREFTYRYPFWSEAQIKRILKNLKNKDYIETGEFNKWNPDRTKWYTISQKGLIMMQNSKALVENENSREVKNDSAITI
jgi:hypothetical protein